MKVDVLVAGGGPAGAMAAKVLSIAGCKVLLVDYDRGARGGESAGPALNPLLRELGLLEDFEAQSHRLSFGNVACWGSANLVAQDFASNPYCHGYQIDRVAFDAMMRSAASESGTLVYSGVRAQVLDPGEEGHSIRVRLSRARNHEDVECRWVIDATGRAARMSRKLGASREDTDVLTAFCCTLEGAGSRDIDGRTFVEAVGDGWWYSALKASGERMVAYLTDLHLADRQSLLSIRGLGAKLYETSHLRALCAKHGYTLSQRPRGQSARSSRLNRAVGRNWVAVGDAALSFDPISSQGLFNALYTGNTGGLSVLRALQGDTAALANYETLLASIWTQYRLNYQRVYRNERRWEKNAFWRPRLET